LTTTASDKKTYSERLHATLDRPEALDDITSGVANGGSVIELAKTWDVRFSDVMKWIHGDPDREKAYIDALNDRAEYEEESIRLELQKLGHVRAADLYYENGDLKPPSEWPDDVAAAVVGIEVDEHADGRADYSEDPDAERPTTITKKVKLANKIKALELHGKMRRLFVDRIDHSGDMTMEQLVAGSMDNKNPPAKPAAPNEETKK